jgi:hypothetical protein
MDLYKYDLKHCQVLTYLYCHDKISPQIFSKRDFDLLIQGLFKLKDWSKLFIFLEHDYVLQTMSLQDRYDFIYQEREATQDQLDEYFGVIEASVNLAVVNIIHAFQNFNVPLFKSSLKEITN